MIHITTKSSAYLSRKLLEKVAMAQFADTEMAPLSTAMHCLLILFWLPFNHFSPKGAHLIIYSRHWHQLLGFPLPSLSLQVNFLATIFFFFYPNWNAFLGVNFWAFNILIFIKFSFSPDCLSLFEDERRRRTGATSLAKLSH